MWPRRVGGIAAGAEGGLRFSSAAIWGFLGCGSFGAKCAVSPYWISLDLLGFSRPNRDLSMGYAGFSESTILSRPLAQWGWRRGSGRRRLRRAGASFM